MFSCSFHVLIEIFSSVLNISFLIYVVAGENLGCFGASKKKKDGPGGNQSRENVTVNRSNTRTEPVSGMELLWQPEVSGRFPFSLTVFFLFVVIFRKIIHQMQNNCLAERKCNILFLTFLFIINSRDENFTLFLKSNKREHLSTYLCQKSNSFWRRINIFNSFFKSLSKVLR